MTLRRRIERVERAAGTPGLRVWLPDQDDDDVVVCVQTGARLPVAEATRLGSGHIVAYNADDWPPIGRTG
jgi:hypothetical protein